MLLLAPWSRLTAADLATVENPSEPRLDTYQGADNDGYFALSVVPPRTVAHQGGCEIVVLVDTSASQTSVVREKALAAFGALLAGLERNDRVQLMAADLDAVPLTAGFVAATSDEMSQAIAALKRRVPLGATDMPVILRPPIALATKSMARGPSFIWAME